MLPRQAWLAVLLRLRGTKGFLEGDTILSRKTLTRLPGADAEAPHISQMPAESGSERKAGPLPDLPTETLHMAYADPPYIGQSKKHYGDHEDYAGEVDHFALIARLLADYPDGWALSLSSPTLHHVLDYCRALGLDLHEGDIRVMAWVKPFAAFKRNVRVAYTWEPVIVKPARRLEGATPTRDHVSEPITLKRGLTGAKPDQFCFWLFDVMGLRSCDTLDDLFPGSGAVSRAWDAWRAQGRLAA